TQAGNRRTDSPDKVARPPLAASSGWESVPSGGRAIYGGFCDLGVSIEWHDFKNNLPVDWSRSFQPDSLGLCLNLSGRGSIRDPSGVMDFTARTAGFYLPQRAGLEAWRSAGEAHQFLTVEFSAEYLGRQLGACDGSLH